MSETNPGGFLFVVGRAGGLEWTDHEMTEGR